MTEKRYLLKKFGNVVLITAITFVLSETATRVLTNHHSVSGMPTTLGVPLLPYRPCAKDVEDALHSSERATYVIRDRELGWCLRPGGSAGIYTANAQGIRTEPDRLVPLERPRGRARIVALGDSFTHGDGVGLEDTWPRRLEQKRSDLEVLNFGVPGYGTDQAILRYRRDASKFEASFAVLGIWPENMGRNLNLLRYYLSPVGGFELTKPRFVFDGEVGRLVNQPILAENEMVEILSRGKVSALLEHERWYEPWEQEFPMLYHLRSIRSAASVYAMVHRRSLRRALYSGEDPSGIEITVKLAKLFRRDVEGTGARPLVLVIPMRELLDEQSMSDSFPLVQALRAAGLTVIDAGPTFAARVESASVDRYFQSNGHLTPEGNDLLAGVMVNALASPLKTAR